MFLSKVTFSISLSFRPIVDRSNGAAEERGTEDAVVIRTPRSFAKLWDIGDFEGQRSEAKVLALNELKKVQSN